MFVKIFSQIHDSSISEDYLARLVFMDLLLLCDENGIVDITIEAIARRTNVPLDVVRAAVRKLEEPDPQSRSRQEDGRRIVRLDERRDWGWRITNYLAYREIRSKEDRRDYQREHKRQQRAKTKATVDNASTHVDNCPQRSTMSTKVEEEAEVEVNSRSPVVEAGTVADRPAACASRRSSPFEDGVIPFASDPEPGYQLEPPRPKLSDDQRLIKTTARYLYANHPANRRGNLERIESALRGLVKNNARPVPELMEHIKRQHALWCKSSDWTDGFVHGLEKWITDGVWRGTPRSGAIDPPGKQEIHRIYPLIT